MIKLIQSMHNLIAALIAKSKSATPFDEALSFNEAGRYKEALAFMEQSAEGGNGRHMAILGTMFLLGDGVAENGKEAERWLKWSIEAGYSEAASVLGMAYATGKAGIKQNIPLACEVLSKAAAEARALRHLARQLALGGHGVLARSQHGESTDLHRRVVLPARRIVRSDSELDTRLEATAAGRRYRGDRIARHILNKK